jgi:tetratricopeptide (TPR) repeat protein
LDLYVTNYLEFDLANPPGGGKKTHYKGVEVYYGPKGVAAQPDRLYRNSGKGHFVDKSEATGVSRLRHPGLGVVFGDYDGDGDLDLYVANDSDPNLLFRNDGNWHFEEIGAISGVSHSEDGRTQAGMGVHAGDFDNDGDLDLFVTNFEDDVNSLYRNLGHWMFADATYEAGLGGIARPYLGWGTGFFDFDNDGWLDLFVANGHLYPQLDLHPSGVKYSQRNLLYHNERGRFFEVGLEAGPGWAIKKASRAAALGDYDNDGDVDLFIMNLNEAPNLLRNEGGNRNNWLGLELVGVESNPDAIGARVQVQAGELIQVREVHRGYGFQAQHDARLLFGLGQRQKVDRVEIRWPSGRLQVFEELPLRRYLHIREDRPEVVAGPQVPGPEFPLVAGEQSEEQPTAAESTPQIGQPHWVAADYAQAGRQFYQGGRYGEARAAFEQAIRLEPDSLQIYANLAVVLAAGMGNDEEALPLLEHILQQDPTRVSIHFLLGKVYLNLDRLPQAIASLKKTVQFSPMSWEAHNWLGLAYLRADSLEAAAMALQRAARGAPWRPGPHQQLARVYEKLDRVQAATNERDIFARLYPLQQQVDWYQELVQLDPQDAAAHSHLGSAYAAQGRFKEAIQEWGRVLYLVPDHPQAEGWIRRARSKLGQSPR